MMMKQKLLPLHNIYVNLKAETIINESNTDDIFE